MAEPQDSLVRFNHVNPVIPCLDLATSIEFYRNLGFKVAWSLGTPAIDAGIVRDNALINLTQDAAKAREMRGVELLLYVDDADELLKEYGDIEPFAPIESKAWGDREFSVRDPQGVVLRFASPARKHPEPR